MMEIVTSLTMATTDLHRSIHTVKPCFEWAHKNPTKLSEKTGVLSTEVPLDTVRILKQWFPLFQTDKFP